MPAPLKAPEARVNRVKPVSEWVDLPPISEPILPAYPTHWYRRELRAFAVPKHIWDLWREDPVTSQWSPGDMAIALELGARFYRLKDADRHRIQTDLGLNAAGRRRLRWRNAPEAASAEQANAQASELRRLRIVQRDEA